jgi:hypothetical protein
LLVVGSAGCSHYSCIAQLQGKIGPIHEALPQVMLFHFSSAEVLEDYNNRFNTPETTKLELSSLNSKVRLTPSWPKLLAEISSSSFKFNI